VAIVLLAIVTRQAQAAESIWIEAEHLRGIKGSCFPDMNQKTAGAWGMSGPGIGPEWTQGGESEWLSIACGPDEDKAAATYDFEIPEAGDWKLWVRYRDWRGHTELFAVRIEQPGQAAIDLVYGDQPVVDENDEMKLMWKSAFGWGLKTLKAKKGKARLTLLAHIKQKVHRQIDCFCLTTDPDYEPSHREKPPSTTWKILAEIHAHPHVSDRPLSSRAGAFTLPGSWKVNTFNDKGFLYLWNVGKPWQDELVSKDARRIAVPFHVPNSLLKEFREKYAGKADMPIFGDPRIVPAFHGSGPTILDNDAFASWLDANPTRPWANMMNYAAPTPLTDKARARWAKYRDRYVGNISGESLGHFAHDAKKLAELVKTARSREEVLKAATTVYMEGSAAQQKKIFKEEDRRHYEYTIPCMSADMTAYAHLCREWGARTVGYESTTCVPSLAMRLAFLRGGARQYNGMWATYRSSNFGDSATIYTEESLYAHPKYVYDNYYDPWTGAGMTWYKFDIWHQYMSGSALFYHEQGFDEFWKPGGQSAGLKPIQLSPKGRLVDQFLRLTRKHPDRGVPYTPIAFLLDRAHGWDPNGYQPSYFGMDVALNPAVLTRSAHAQMLKEWFKVAYYPYGPREADLTTGVNPTYIPGVFGDIFDVLVTSRTRMNDLSDYAVVILNGEVSLSEEWGRKLAEHLQAGGTVIGCDDQVQGPGVAALKLPLLGAAAEDTSFEWKPLKKKISTQRFRYRPIKGGTPLASAANGDAIAAVFEHGKGRLVFLSIPKGLGIDGMATPLSALVLANARQGLVPVEVEGDVEWLLNRTEKGWLITLINPAGSHKPQHGMVVTDYRQKRKVKIRADLKWTKAVEWFDDVELPLVKDGEQTVASVTVPAGGLRIVEVQ
jgi:hypothetical protein